MPKSLPDARPGLPKAKGGDPVEQDTATTLYQVTMDYGAPVWTFCNVPRAFDGDGAGRLGSKYTRWDAKPSVFSDQKEERRKGEMPQNWYSLTANEIYPLACAEGVSEEALAISTAKLSHQVQFWDGRSRFPLPLHAAKQMDLAPRSTGAPPRRRRSHSRNPVPRTHRLKKLRITGSRTRCGGLWAQYREALRNCPHGWSNGPRYLIDPLKRVVTVSLE
ncbi:RNaseH domain-containing protein [Kitasatospora sp. NPDC059327]|uniref:RNaseH domain-containing protein n=1 Tax=Kitasatospora sp. NPDC059327 TaxID=3346803 RepID=UPI0036BB3E97